MKKKWIAAVLAATVALTATACGGADTDIFNLEVIVFQYLI